MQSSSQVKFSSNIYSQNRKDPRSGISVNSAANLDVAMYWESINKDNPRPSTTANNRDHLTEMWTFPNNKRSSQSKYREVYGNSEELTQIRNESDRTHHKKKDWLKTYFESMHKNKKFSR